MWWWRYPICQQCYDTYQLWFRSTERGPQPAAPINFYRWSPLLSSLALRIHILTLFVKIWIGHCWPVTLIESIEFHEMTLQTLDCYCLMDHSRNTLILQAFYTTWMCSPLVSVLRKENQVIRKWRDTFIIRLSWDRIQQIAANSSTGPK